MPAFRKFGCYWGDLYKTAREGHDMVAGGVLLIVFLASVVFGVSFSPEFENIIQWALGVLFGMWALLWLPFRLHEAQKEKHALEVQELKRGTGRATTLIQIVDLIRSEKHMDRRFDPIGALIKHASDMESEEDVEWICDQLSKHGHEHPFWVMESSVSGAFRGRRLNFLREAQLQKEEIRSATHAWSFAVLRWSHADAVKTQKREKDEAAQQTKRPTTA